MAALAWDVWMGERLWSSIRGVEGRVAGSLDERVLSGMMAAAA